MLAAVRLLVLVALVGLVLLGRVVLLAVLRVEQALLRVALVR